MSLNTRIFTGAALGILLGLWMSRMGTDAGVGAMLFYLCELASTLFVAMLKMVVVPLIFVSIVVGVASLRQHRQMHRVWITTLVFYTFTAAIAVVLGVFCMQVFKPGEGLEIAMFDKALASGSASQLSKLDLPDFIQHFLSGLFANPVAAMAQGNVMAVVVFALLMGVALVRGGEKYPRIQGLMEELFELVMQLVNWIMHIAPLGVFALLAKLLATQDAAVFAGLGKFVAVVLGSTLFHGIVILPLLVYLIARVTPLALWRGAKPALVTAFATSSSSATLPVTMRCLDEMKVPRRISGFVAPLGAQVNMDGTALYEAAAALFIASLVGIDLSLGQQMLVCLMAMIAAVGAPGIPSAGMVTMVMVLQSVGLPAEAIGILLPMDRLLDTVRTTVNVEGDFAGSLVVNRFCREA